MRYRYSDHVSEEGIILRLSEYQEIKKTPLGCWVIEVYLGFTIGKPRFVLDGPGKRYCHETKEMALDSYKRRKKRQRLLAQDNLDKAEFALSVLENMTEPPSKTTNIGMASYMRNYVFD